MSPASGSPTNPVSTACPSSTTDAAGRPSSQPTIISAKYSRMQSSGVSIARATCVCPRAMRCSVARSSARDPSVMS